MSSDEKCSTCGRSVFSPYRVHATNGKVTAGCVDKSHDGHLIGESLRFHNRKEAKAIRRALAKGRAGKGYSST